MGQYANQPSFATTAAPLTPSDTVNESTNLNASAIYVGGEGDLRVVMVGAKASEALTFKGLTAGSFLPIIVDYVLATGTTATELIKVK